MFNRDVDVHTATAAQVYHREPEDVTKQMRRTATSREFRHPVRHEPARPERRHRHDLRTGPGTLSKPYMDFRNRSSATWKI